MRIADQPVAAGAIPAGGVGGGFGRAAAAANGPMPAAGGMADRFAGMYVPDGEAFGGGRGGRGRGLDRRKALPEPPPFVVREYAHQHAPSSAGDRTDFAETVFWHPVLVLPKDGAKVSFDLSDDVTRYQVLVAAHTLDGRLGALETDHRSPQAVQRRTEVAGRDHRRRPDRRAGDARQRH